jgi:hypothetical protein
MFAVGRIKARQPKPLLARSIAWGTNPRRIVSSAMSAVMDTISTDLQAATASAARLEMIVIGQPRPSPAGASLASLPWAAQRCTRGRFGCQNQVYELLQTPAEYLDDEHWQCARLGTSPPRGGP